LSIDSQSIPQNGFEVSDQLSSRAFATNVDHSCEAAIRVTTQADADVVDRIHRWFSQHGVAWAGTPGELARILGGTPEQLMHAMEEASVTLLVFGISASVFRRSGQPMIIVLRRLELIGNSVGAIGSPRQPLHSEHPAQRTIGQLHSSINANQGTCESVSNSPTTEEERFQVADAPKSEAAEPFPLSTLTLAVEFPRNAHPKLRWTICVIAIIAGFAVAMGYRAAFHQRWTVAPGPSQPMRKPVFGTFRPDVAETKPLVSVESFKTTSTEIAGLYKKAQQNDADAQYTLGLRLLRGDRLPRNDAEAVGWFERAARMGDARAQFQLGMAYSSGRGVGQDYVAGYTWITTASVNGETEAESTMRQLTPKLSRSGIARVRLNLAEMYTKGIGVRADKTTAYIWYVLAEAAGENRSTQAKSELASSMTPEEVYYANATALSWLKKHQL
jgi:hypothetical protein